MKDFEKTNTLGEKVEKITLEGYYHSLPNAKYPKSEFLHKIMERCGVSLSTVRNWIDHGMRPCNPEHVKILCEETGINEKDLWNDEKS